MDPEVFRSYLIKLGVQVDTAAFDKMKKMLNDLEGVMGKHASSTAMQATKGVGIIVGAYATLMVSIGKLIKTTADADMQFQLLGQKMYMSTEAVKAFKQATDTLGHSVQEIAWNAELREKYFILVKDIQNLSVPQDAKDMMKQVRGIGFEFDRLKLASKLTLEQIAYNLMRINKGELTDIRTIFGNWVDKVYSQIPEMARKIADFLQPFVEIGKSVIKFFKDMWESMKPTRDLLGQIIDKVKEFSGEIPPAIKQVMLLAGALGLIFALKSPIMIAIGVFVAALALIDDYMKFKDGKESLNALVPIWIALEYVVSKAATAMGMFGIAYSHFIAFMKGEKHESGKTFFEDVSDYAVFSEKNLRERWRNIGEKREASVARNAAIEAGESVGETGGATGPIGAQEFGPAGAPAGAPAGGTTKGGKQTRGVRNNNPGNLEYGPFAISHGATGSDGRFAIFPTMEMGIQAQQALIFKGKNYRGLTVRQMIHRYAPRGDKNNEEAYVARIASLAGINPDGKTMQEFTPAERNAVSNAMFIHESRYSMMGGGKSQAKTVASTGDGFGGGGGAPKSVPRSATEEVSDVFQQSMGKYPEISRYFDEVTKNSNKAVDTAKEAVKLSKETLKTAEKVSEKAKESKVYTDSKGTKFRGISGFQELLPTSKTKKIAESVKAGKKKYEMPLALQLHPMNLATSPAMQRFGKYTAEAFGGALPIALGVAGDKAMKAVLGKNLYKKYDVATRQLDAKMRATEKKVVNQISIVVHAGAANAEQVGEVVKKKFNELTGRDKNKSGVRKGLLK